jgi:hypothetical protein
MTATITAVNADPGAGSLGPGAMTEHTLQAFVTGLQNSSTFGTPRLANPAALASELFSNMRGYFERARNLERAIGSLRSTEASGNSANVVLASMLDAPRTDLHGGPARESLEPAGADGDVPSLVRTRLAELERFETITLQAMNFDNETLLIGQQAFQAVHSVNTLIKGQ